MPRIWCAVHHQPTPARANSRTTSPSRPRIATNAGTYAGPDGGRLLGSDRGHGDQAAQENSEVERPVLPS